MNFPLSSDSWKKEPIKIKVLNIPKCKQPIKSEYAKVASLLRPSVFTIQSKKKIVEKDMGFLAKKSRDIEKEKNGKKDKFSLVIYKRIPS